jgi:putative peptide zinc metalloprotease protein
MRPDLQIEQHTHQGKLFWVIKEPLGLRYFRFLEEDFRLLTWLDGTCSLDDLKARFDEEFVPQTITVPDLWQFVSMLHDNNMLVSNATGQGVQLHKRDRERRWKDFKARVSNVLAIRVKGIDPDPFLAWLYRWTSWFFTKTAVVLCGLLGLSAVGLILVHFNTFQTRLPTFHEFFASSNWIYLGCVLVGTKVLHEFGHGLSCKHFGCECHELGVLLLVFTPCMYCDVSDSWRLRSKWKRAAVAAAGMYVELCLASIATWIWWNTSGESVLNNICLCIMFVSSVSTLMFNANPLMRYDGYYILSDLTEIPNLREKSVTSLSRKAGQWLFEMDEPDTTYYPERNTGFFAAYAVAATLYSWFVTISILWFLHRVLKPYRLEIFGELMALFSLWSLAALPITTGVKYLTVPGRITTVRKMRMALAAAVVLLLLAAVIWLPLPYHVTCQLEIRPREAASIYVATPGRLDQICVQAGEHVASGTVLAVTQNSDVAARLLEIESRRTLNATEIKNLNFLSGAAAAEARKQLPQLQESLRSLDEQLAEKRREQAFLTLRAPTAGTILPPPPNQPQTDDDAALPTWSGTPLDPQNLGAWLPTRTLFCQIGDPTKWEAILIIDQADMDFVQRQQTVSIKLDELPDQTFTGTISDISNTDLKIAPQALSHKNGGALTTKGTAAGSERPLNISYEARVPLDDPQQVLLPRLRGRAKIDAGSMSLGDRLWRYISHAFSFSS